MEAEVMDYEVTVNEVTEAEEVEAEEVVKEITDMPIPYIKEYSQFDIERYREMKAEERAEYIGSLVNHTMQFENLWCLSLPLDVTGSIVTEICRGKLYENANAKTALELVKSNYSKSGKSWVICWAKNSNISAAVFRF